MIAAIHQPNFFPWLGYFRKIARADCFIFLDSVQFPRTGKGTWTNRVRMLIAGEARWVTCPIQRSSSLAPISDIRMDDAQPWRDKVLRSIAMNYRRTAHFGQVLPMVEGLMAQKTDSLAAFNMTTVTTIATALGIERRFECSSKLMDGTAGEAGSALLAGLCQAVGADTYLAGDGAGGYERPEEYALRGITLMRNQFVCRPYPQVGATEFVPGLTVLDALFNLGVDGTRRLILEE